MADTVLLKEYEITLDLKKPIPMRDFEVVEDFLHHALRLVPLFFRSDIFFAVVRIPL